MLEINDGFFTLKMTPTELSQMGDNERFIKCFIKCTAQMYLPTRVLEQVIRNFDNLEDISYLGEDYMKLDPPDDVSIKTIADNIISANPRAKVLFQRFGGEAVAAEIDVVSKNNSSTLVIILFSVSNISVRFSIGIYNDIYITFHA